MTSDGDTPMAKLRRQNGRDKAWKVKYLGWATRAGDAVETCAQSTTLTSSAVTPYIAATMMATSSTRLHQEPATTITTGPRC